VALSGVRPAAHAPAISPAAGNAGYRERIGVHEALRRYSLSAGVALRTPEATASRTPDDVPGFSPVQGGLFGSTAAERHGSTFSSLDFLGQFEGTYLVFSAPGAMILLDQHAAHERVLYERLRHSRQGDLEIQSLLIPEILELGPREMDLLVSSGDLLRRAGFEIEAFGERSIIIKSMPSMLGPTDVKGLVADIFESIADPGLPGDEKLDRIFIGMACRGAIKAHQVLTIEEVRRLCSDLDSIPFASNCPHGRPVFIEFPASAVEKLFKRT
jgi:DNA mismatch repair protein MutL